VLIFNSDIEDDRTISLRVKVWPLNITLTPSLFIEVSVSRQGVTVHIC